MDACIAQKVALRGRLDAFGNHLADGYLVEHDVLSPDSARYLADKISPPPLGLPVHLSVYALMLEVWCQQMSSVP